MECCIVRADPGEQNTIWGLNSTKHPARAGARCASGEAAAAGHGAIRCKERPEHRRRASVGVLQSLEGEQWP